MLVIIVLMIGKLIVQARKNARKSQVQTFHELKGKGLKDSFSTYVRWELGVSEPHYTQIALLADVLGVAPSYFFDAKYN